MSPQAPGRFRETLISGDSHVVEQANLWLDNLPASLRDRAPRVEKLPRALEAKEQR